MASGEFGKPTVLPELEAAYRAQNAEECYRLIEGMPFGTVLNVDKAVFELTSALPEEFELLEISIAEGREYALVASDEKSYVLRGEGLAVGLDDFYPEIAWTIIPEDKEGIFSHTHPSREHHPFPSWGDVRHWQMIADRWPNVQNRIVFRGNDGTKVFRFIEFYGQLFAAE